MNQLKRLFFLLTLLIYSSTYAGPIKAIIFDCDGTLIDYASILYAEWHETLKVYNYELTQEEFWQFLFQNDLVGDSNAEALLATYYAKILKSDCATELLAERSRISIALHETFPFPPIDSTVNFLRILGENKEKLGIKIGLASGGTKKHIMATLKRLKIDHYFNAISSGVDDMAAYNDPQGTNKPQPYVYLHAIKLLGVLPQECVAIEDSRAGILAAISAGCLAVAIPNPYTIKQNFSQAHLQINSLADVTPAEFLEKMATFY